MVICYTYYIYKKIDNFKKNIKKIYTKIFLCAILCLQYKNREIIILEKIAVILIDTYSAKLIIAGTEKPDTFLVIDKEVEQINLGLEQEDHFLKKPQIDECLRVFKNFRKICEMHACAKTIAVANFDQETKPKNIYSFFDEVFATCGFRFSVMPAEDQNNAIYSGIINTYDLPKGLIANITANSVHLVEYNRRNLLNSTVLGFGPLSLLKMFPIAELGAGVAFTKMEKYIENQLSDASFIEGVDPEFAFIGSGLYYTDLAKMVRKLKKYPLDKDDTLEVSVDDANKIYAQLKTMDLVGGKKLKGIDEPRADVFVASLAIMCGLFAASKRESVTIASRGLVEGLLLAEFVPSTSEKPVSDVLGFGLENNLTSYTADELKHSEQVYGLAMLLFKQLRVLHKLPRGYVKVLRIASVLHDSGKKINYIDHAKYSYNVILGSEIFGTNHRELILAGFVASLHMGGDIPLSEWIKYKDIITEEDLDAVKKLGVILALAENLDRTKNGIVVDINCDILGDSVIMKTVATADADYQIRKALECGKDFEKNFHKKLEIL